MCGYKSVVGQITMKICKCVVQNFCFAPNTMKLYKFMVQNVLLF